jgi:G8 domain
MTLAACGDGAAPADESASPTADPTSVPSLAPIAAPPAPATPAAPAVPVDAMRWSNPATWGGTLPGAGAQVVVPAGRTIILDTDTASLGALDIQGTLAFEDRDVALTATSIHVGGTLSIGSAARPFVSKATITLTGAPAAANDGVSRGIVVSGGQLSLYGAVPSPVWTKLNDHAQAGATSFTLADSVNWAAGSTIAVAPTDFYSVAQTERLTVANVNGQRIATTAGIAKPRWGKLQYVTAQGMSLTPDPSYAPPVAPAPTVLDERAEVANLSRNIVIQSADDSAWRNNGFGVHLMVMNLSSKVTIDGVEFRRAGQAGVTGRYPIHWHMLSYSTAGQFIGDATGHAVRNSSVWGSVNRCIVLHATNGVQVKNNICEDIKGHAFFLEDAVERRNVFEGNLALMVRSPPPDKVLQLHEGTTSNGGPSGFWLTNPDNIVRNNNAGDASGLGFWLAYPNKPLGLSAAVAMAPNHLQHAAFEYNTAHSNQMPGVMMKFAPIDAAGNVDASIKYVPTSDGGPDTGTSSSVGNRLRFTLKGVVSYKNRGGAYRNVTSLPDYLEWVTADNVGVHFGGAVIEGTLQRGLMVGMSLNNATPYFDQYPYEPASAFATYHSTLAIKDNTTVNFPFVEGKPSGAFRTDDFYLRPVEVGSARNTNNRMIASSSGYRTLPPNLDGQPYDTRNYTLAGAMWDTNGYWGPKGNYWVYDYPFFTAGGHCQQTAPAGKNGQSCDGQYLGITGFQTDFSPDPNLFFSAMQAVRQDGNGAEIGRWIVNDGSKDPTKAVFRHFAARSGGRFVLRFPNDPLPKSIAMTVNNAYRDNDTLLLGIGFDGRVTPAGYTVAGTNSHRMDPKVWTPEMPYYKYARYFKPAASLAEVTAGNGDLMWQDKANNLVWVKYRGGLGYPFEYELPIVPGSDEDLLRQYSVVLYPKP